MLDINAVELYRRLIEETGEDVDREGLRATPERAAKAFKDLTSGYAQDIEELINNAMFPSESDEMVIVKDIELYSLCEHHLLPFFGKAHVAYLPQGKVIGLSKIARIVDAFAHRLQIQESLTTQIAKCIEKYTNAGGVGVVIEARHMCMMMRGVGKQHSAMTTSCMLGSFRDNQSTRAEFLNLVNRP